MEVEVETGCADCCGCGCGWWPGNETKAEGDESVEAVHGDALPLPERAGGGGHIRGALAALACALACALWAL